MSTCGNVVMERDGKYRVIYTHWDSYPSHNGKILLNSYTNPEKVWQLIQLGSISILGDEIGEKHAFENPPEGVVTAYNRDREEPWDDTKYQTFDSKEDALKVCDNDYTYLFKNGKWTFRKWDEKKFHKLTQKVCQED